MRRYVLTGKYTVLESIQEHDRVMNVLRALTDKEDDALLTAFDYCKKHKLRTITDEVSASLIGGLTIHASEISKKIEAVMPHLEALGFLVQEQ